MRLGQVKPRKYMLGQVRSRRTRLGQVRSGISGYVILGQVRPVIVC
jgi:hypothetical protein